VKQLFASGPATSGMDPIFARAHKEKASIGEFLVFVQSLSSYMLHQNICYDAGTLPLFGDPRE